MKSEYFKDAKDRDRRAGELVRARNKGILVQVPQRAEQAEWQAFKTAIGDAPWQDVVAGWKAHQKASGVIRCSLTVQQAVEAYLKKIDGLETERQISEDTVRQKRQKVEAFAAAFGGNRLTQVTGEDIEDWIESDLGYVPTVVRLLIEEKEEEKIVAFLHKIAAERMGLSENPATLAHEQKVAALLLRHFQDLKRTA